jgi:hypothetical protein
LEIEKFDLEKAKEISESLTVNKNITEIQLCLKNSRIIYYEIKNMLKFLEYNKTLRKIDLNLSNNKIDDEVAEHLFKAFSENTD